MQKMQKISHNDYHLLLIAKLINHYFCNNDFQFFAQILQQWLSIFCKNAHSIYSDIIHLSNFFTIFIHNHTIFSYMIPFKLFNNIYTQFILLEEENSIQYFLYDPSQTFVSCHARQFM